MTDTSLRKKSGMTKRPCRYRRKGNLPATSAAAKATATRAAPKGAAAKAASRSSAKAASAAETAA